MSDNFILACDPGGTTGWALYSKWEEESEADIDSGQLPFDEFVRYADKLSHDMKMTAIVAERFTISQRTVKLSQQTTALEVIGFLRYLALREDIPFVLQTPADAKRFAALDGNATGRLDILEWTQRPLAKHDHENDALRHLLLYLVKNHLIEAPRA